MGIITAIHVLFTKKKCKTENFILFNKFSVNTADFIREELPFFKE